MKGRRGLVASAATVILLIMGFLFATAPNWRSLLAGHSDKPASPTVPASNSATPSQPPPGEAGSEAKSAATGTPAQPGSSPTEPGSTTSAGQQQANLAEPASGSKSSPSGPTADQAPGSAAGESPGNVPSFDIVRVEPSGDSVIAARGAPNADVVLLDGDVPIAQAKADANGQVALLPPPLKPGEHSLTLTTTGPGGKTVSSQSVAVSMPNQPKTPPLVALIQPNQPATILSGPVAGGGPSARKTGETSAPATTPSPAPATVVIRSVEVESFGSFYASGKAPPGSASRIYLNGAFVATVTADSNGNWSLKINKGMKPGRYAVRIDQTDPGGKVIARAEVPFDYPAQVASAAARPDGAKKNTSSRLGGSSGPVIVGSSGPPGSTDPASAGQGADGGRLAAAGRSDTTAGVTAGSPGSVPAGGKGAGPPSSSVAVMAGTAPAASGSAGSATGAGAKSAPPTGPKVSADAQNKGRSQTVVASNDGGQGQGVPPLSQGSGALVASDGARPSASGGIGQDDASVPTVVAELVTAKVIRGDSLWRISRQMLGHGMRYTQIYAANTQQIRDPKLIYPGQVFVLPHQ